MKIIIFGRTEYEVNFYDILKKLVFFPPKVQALLLATSHFLYIQNALCTSKVSWSYISWDGEIIYIGFFMMGILMYRALVWKKAQEV